MRGCQYRAVDWRNQPSVSIAGSNPAHHHPGRSGYTKVPIRLGILGEPGGELKGDVWFIFLRHTIPIVDIRMMSDFELIQQVNVRWKHLTKFQRYNSQIVGMGLYFMQENIQENADQI